jgi:hypothetical protein
MFTKARVFFLLIAFLLVVAGPAVAQSLWPMEVGQWCEYDKVDSAGNKWVVKFDVVGTEVFGSAEYFHVQIHNNEPPTKLLQDVYFRSTDKELYQYVGGEELILQLGPVGTKWSYYRPDKGYNQIEQVISIGPVTVPYETFPEAYVISSYQDKNSDGIPDIHDVDDYIVPGFGMVKEIDFNSNHHPPLTAVLARAGATLSVLKTGSGPGTVTSSPKGISCGTDCTQPYSYSTAVTLTATAKPGSAFTGWSGGGCAGTGTCTVTISNSISVTAAFTAQPVLTVSPRSLNLGAVKKDGTSAARIVAIKNTGAPGSVLTLGTPDITGANALEFTADATLCSDPLPKNGSCTISVTYTPASWDSPKSAMLKVYSDAPKNGTISVKLMGTSGAPKISVSPAALSFGTIGITPAVPPVKSITISNSGISDLVFDSPAAADTSFTVGAYSCGTISKGKTCKVPISFSPITDGKKDCDLTIHSNDPLHDTKTVRLKGTGK